MTSLKLPFFLCGYLAYQGPGSKLAVPALLELHSVKYVCLSRPGHECEPISQEKKIGAKCTIGPGEPMVSVEHRPNLTASKAVHFEEHCFLWTSFCFAILLFLIYPMYLLKFLLLRWKWGLGYPGSVHRDESWWGLGETACDAGEQTRICCMQGKCLDPRISSTSI